MGYLEDSSITTGLKVGSSYKQDGTGKELRQGPLLAVLRLCMGFYKIEKYVLIFAGIATK
ncbi:hypothetical protein [Cylindrospermopsis curvispora]|uniref:Uncharacterized protein n=1 Tax=Cylindrospermopsis curvispora GIHE-G1 TaxID=2666332 RepID=A0A7H0F1H1_9CYAN|nr:hypothetical protein [Cylindrospermopsis curvispora]QNP29887.1 hypothetical protein IAR63_01935 [Cylindrospermopsis curvispora GIHE-G1]